MTVTSTVDRTEGSARGLSARTLRTYAADWALFTDWCAATDTIALPADPQTVVEFLTACPAAPATSRCRVAAIDHHHTTPGYERPGESAVLRAALGRPTGEPFQPKETDREAVQAALRGLPSHGWTQGMFGRRDRALVVLSQLAGVPELDGVVLVAPRDICAGHSVGALAKALRSTSITPDSPAPREPMPNTSALYSSGGESKFLPVDVQCSLRLTCGCARAGPIRQVPLVTATPAGPASTGRNWRSETSGRSSARVDSRSARSMRGSRATTPAPQ